MVKSRMIHLVILGVLAVLGLWVVSTHAQSAPRMQGVEYPARRVVGDKLCITGWYYSEMVKDFVHEERCFPMQANLKEEK